MTTPADQLDAMRRLPENWDGYGAAPVAEEIIDFAQELVGFVEAALNRGGANAPGIHVSPTRVGGVLVEWDDAAMEHEVQIDPDFCLSFLHYDKSTGHITTRSFGPGSPAAVDPGLLQELRQLLAA